jgi:hypothetical protein
MLERTQARPSLDQYQILPEGSLEKPISRHHRHERPCGHRAVRHKLGDVHEEWRVNLMIHNSPIIKKKVSARAVRGLLRDRVGEDVHITDGRASTFLYAATAGAAETAERTAQEVLAEQGLAGDIRIERWDLSRKAWVDARTGLPADVDVNTPGRRLLSRVGNMIIGIFQGMGDSGP